jgi:hypothetical protein
MPNGGPEYQELFLNQFAPAYGSPMESRLRSVDGEIVHLEHIKGYRVAELDHAVAELTWSSYANHALCYPARLGWKELPPEIAKRMHQQQSNTRNVMWVYPSMFFRVRQQEWDDEFGEGTPISSIIGWVMEDPVEEIVYVSGFDSDERNTYSWDNERVPTWVGGHVEWQLLEDSPDRILNRWREYHGEGFQDHRRKYGEVPLFENDPNRLTPLRIKMIIRDTGAL